MPTYQYNCPSCDHNFEEFQSITEDPIEKCPKCGKKPRRIISGGSGFLLKGTGFYQTDYRSSQYQADAKKDKPSSTTKSESSSDSGSGKGSKKPSESKKSTDSKQKSN